MSNETAPKAEIIKPQTAEQKLAEAQQIGNTALANSEVPKKDIREYSLPDGTYFKGTAEEYREEVKDYYDRIAQ